MTVYIDFSYGTPEVGWCDVCLLPSRIDVPVFALYDSGVSRFGTISRCTQHEGLDDGP